MNLSSFMFNSLQEASKNIMNTYTEFYKTISNPYLWKNPYKIYSNYFDLISKKQPLEWATYNKIILQGQAMNLLHFPNSNEITAKYPILIIPPQAGHDSKIADYAPNQSVVRTFQNQGFNTYVCEWASAEEKDANLGIEDYINFIHNAVEKIKEINNISKVYMLGQCQGGWASAIYTSLYSENIASLIVAAAPIDFEAKKGVLNYIVDNNPIEFFENLVQLGKGVLPGIFMLTGFKTIQAYEHYHLKFIKVFTMGMQNDEKAIERSKHFEKWYENSQNLPGKFYLETIQNIFKNNCLTKPNLFKINGNGVDLRNINCPLILIGGTNDHITLPEQVFAMKNLVSTPKENITEVLVEAGHIGALMGSKVLKENYPIICDKLKRMN